MIKRLLMPMLVVGIIFTMGSMAAYAQITCSITSVGLAIGAVAALPGPSANASNVGHTELIGAGASGIPDVPGGGRLRVSCTNAGAGTNPGVVVLTISLGVPITNNQTHPSTATGIRIINGTGDFLTPGPQTPTGAATTNAATYNVGLNLITNSAGTLVVGLGTPGATVGSATTTAIVPTTGIFFNGGVTSTFELAGVLVSTNGKSGAINANLTASGGINIIAGTGTCPAGPGPCTQAITNVLASIADPTVPTGSLPASVTAFGTAANPVAGGAAVLNSSGGPVKANFVLRLQEGYVDAFKNDTQFNFGAVFPASTSTDTLVNVALNNIPAGFTIGGCAVVDTDVNGLAPTGAGFSGSTPALQPSISATNFTAASPVLTVNFNGPVDPGNLDVLWIVCTNIAAGTATLPLPSTPITAQAYMGPLGTALSSTSTVLTGLTTGLIPRYQQLLVPTTAVTVVVFPASKTDLLLTFAFVGPGYNTGVAVSNTTTDPFTPAAGGAASTEGTVTFLMVKNDGTTKSYTTTTGSPGGGLTGAGVVKSGSTYVVNLSEILTAANFGTTFSGYVFISANFTFAHGAATIYTTSTGAAALSSPVLVVTNGAGGGVTSAGARVSPEGLGQ